MKFPRKSPSSVAVLLGVASLAGFATPRAEAQSQSLAFTGGVLLNTRISFHGLGAHNTGSQPGPATGGSVDRTYDDGFNKVDATGNPANTTVNWGYQRTDQFRRTGDIVLANGTAPGNLSIDDAGSFIEPSGYLEYRGSLGPADNADWGVLLGVGYQSVGAKESESFVTDATLLEDAYSTGDVPPGLIPPPPYTGSATATGARISSVPNRSERTLVAGRMLSGTWEFDAELIPIMGGLYYETQIAGRLNAIASAGILALLVNANITYHETSTIGQMNPVKADGGEGTNDFVIGGFVQLGLDWALWEKASIVASARWQPAESFNHSIGGREAEIDFMTAFAVHAGFAFRF